MVIMLFMGMIFGVSEWPELSECFGSKHQLCKTCCSVTGDKLEDLLPVWKDITIVYKAIGSDTSSFGYQESVKFEFFYALCCLSIKGIPVSDFLREFNAFYDNVCIEEKTQTSASFLMVCAVLEGDPIKGFETSA